MRKSPRHVEGAPSVRDLLLGKPPHRNSHARHIQGVILSICPAIFDGGREVMLAQCGGSPPFYELVRGLWRAAKTCVGNKGDRIAAETRFASDLYEARGILGRITYVHTAIDRDLDLGSDGPEEEFFDTVRLLLADMGDREARAEIADLAWRHARLRERGEDDLLYCAGGASLYAEEPWRFQQWRPGGGPTGFMRDCIEFGRAAFTGTLPQAEPEWAKEAKATAGLRAIEATRAEAGPSLLVLSSVDHLPGSAKSGEGALSGSRGTTARTEWAPFAGRRIRLVEVPDLRRVRRRLVAEFPDAEAIIDSVLAPLAGRPFVQIAPLLIVGAPGSGKSRLARRIGEELGLSVAVYGCSSVADGTILSTSRQWSTGRASMPLQTIRRFDVANPMIILDEIEKAGTRRDNGTLADAVLGLTERETARVHFDMYLEIEVDLSNVSYIATANNLDGIRAALLSRFKVLAMPAPTLASLPVLARSLAEEIRQERGQSEAWMPDCDPEELALIAAEWSQREPSVRLLRRLVETVLAGRDGLAPRH